MDAFKLINEVIKREGGYVNHPADKGGPTNMGITQRTLTMYLARETTVDDVKNLNQQTARDIYYMYYWVNTGVNLLPELIQPIVFDMVVNMGKRGVKLLQTALENRGYYYDAIDGKIGPRTLLAAKSACEDLGNELLKTLVRRRVIYYEGLVKNDDTQRVFLSGWIARAESFL